MSALPIPAARQGLRIALVLLACLLTMLVWGRVEIGNGFSILIGDWLDGRIQIAITDHWLNFLRGKARWNEMAYFFPWPDTLGYNEGFMLFGLPFALCRSLGADPFLAFEIADAVIRAIGFLSCCVFAADCLGLGIGWSILAGALFTLSSGAYLQEGHSQLLAVSFAPLVGWLLLRLLRSLTLRSSWPAMLWGTVASVLYGAWLLTCVYMAWFATFFAVLALLSAAGCELLDRGVGWRSWRAALQRPLLPIAAILAICVVPFLVVYLPKSHETGGHPYAEALFYTPSLLDMLHVGPDNLLFGGFDRWLTATVRPGFPPYGEKTIGFPPLIALFALAGSIVALRGMGSRPFAFRVIAVASLASLVLMLHIRDYTLWYWVFKYAPGAGAVRVIARYALFLALPVTLLAVGFLAACARRLPRWVIAACVAFLLLEEVTETHSIALDRAHEMHLLEAVPPAPSQCRAFFISAPWFRSPMIPAIDQVYPQNVDAMIISEERALPTINGYATFTPPDWAFDSITRPDYLDRVRKYATAHGISGLCGLNLASNQWDIDPLR